MDLPAMRERLRRDLRDSDPANERWPDEALDRHIERAVRELSLAAPLETSTALRTVAGSRDLSVATLTDRVSIEAVEYPVGLYPPSRPPFSLWGDTLTLQVGAPPDGGEAVAVHYSKLHTLDDTGSTLPEALDDLVATGAGAYAALEWASFAVNRVNVGGADTWRHYHVWAQERLAEFARALARHGRARRARSSVLSSPHGG